MILWEGYVCILVRQSHAFWWGGHATHFWFCLFAFNFFIIQPVASLHLSASCVCRHIFEFHVFLRVCSVFLHLATHIFGFLCVFSSFSCIPWGLQVSCCFTVPLCWHSTLSTLALTAHCTHRTHISKLYGWGKVSTSVWFDIWKLWKYGKYFTLAPNGCHVWWRSSTWQSPIVALLCFIGAADTPVRIWGRFKTGFCAQRLLNFGRFYEDLDLFLAFWQIHALPVLAYNSMTFVLWF